MGLPRARTSFGIHQMTALNKTDGVPYGTIKVLAGATSSNERESIDLYGGSNPNIVDSEDGNVSNELSITIKEFNKFLYELAGYSTYDAALTAATVGRLGYFNTSTKAMVWESDNTAIGVAEERKGDGWCDATNGLAPEGIKITTASDVKPGVYVLKNVTSTTFDCYILQDNEFEEGTEINYEDATMTVVSGITFGLAGEEITGTGITIKGKGTPTLSSTEGDDVLIFHVLGAHSDFSEVWYTESPTPVEFELFLTSQKKANGEYYRDHYPRVKLANIPTNMTEKEWAEAELKLKVLYDSTYGYSFKRTDVTLGTV